MEEFLKHAAEREALHQTAIDRAARNVIEAFDQRYSIRLIGRFEQVVAKLKRNVGKFLSRFGAGGRHDC